ncbi:MAG: MBL fold metallo-hydrolase, partial [Clostridia bacterium]|nr:MBL fold metallo-hydrolase [Clostridia bacterium]
CGAARTVTGSCHLIECKSGKILVDCGMRQGADKKGEYGEDKFPFNPAEISAALLTHAHIDHSGLFPLLVKQGFIGPIMSTEATAQLCTIMLPDSAHIQEQDAEWQNRKNQRAGKPLVEPLYTSEDAANALKQFRPVGYSSVVELLPGVKVRFNDVGHLLGSAAIEIWVEEDGKTTKLVFSGDIGRRERPIINDPVRVEGADYLIMEGTYGDRNHDLVTDAAKEASFANILRAGIARGGNIVIPSFAVGRTQELVYYIKRLIEKNKVPGLEKVPVYIDSPLSIEATRIYERCAVGYYDEEAMELAKDGSPFDFPNLRISRTADESKLINAATGCNIIISSSGMCDAGRIRHHLKHNLYRADSTILFVGYQAVGTLGRMLLDGKKKIKLFGEEIAVNATIEQISGFSGHAGRDELIEWMCGVGKSQRVFLVHGEEEALTSLAGAVRSLGYEVEIPTLGSVYDLAAGEVVSSPAPEAADIRVEDLARDAGIKQDIERIFQLLKSVEDRRSPDMELKLDIMEADVRSLADKWEKLLG